GQVPQTGDAGRHDRVPHDQDVAAQDDVVVPRRGQGRGPARRRSRGRRDDGGRAGMTSIDATARVAPGAVIGTDVSIGPYCVIGPNAVIGDGCRLVAHVHITVHTTIGPRTVIYPFASLGTPPQSTRYRGGPTRLTIGADCDLRESVTMNLGTEDGGGITTVGDRGFFMANSHVGHDCHVGNDVVFANCATL